MPPSARLLTIDGSMYDHAAFMDERDARQRDLIRRLADEIDMWVDCYPHDTPDETKDLLAEARGIEATNE
jgi:hypothetical protein